MIATDRIRLEPAEPRHAEALCAYYQRNAPHLASWEPIRPCEAQHAEYWKNWAGLKATGFQAGTDVSFLAFRNQEDRICAVCNFSNIVRGAFQACRVGYSVSQSEQGKGIATETVQAGLNYVFDELDLHRVMANYMPSNKRSERVLTKLGFEREGFARSYVKIAGVWQDHILTSKLNPRHHDQSTW